MCPKARFCDHCGEPLEGGGHVHCARQRRLEPPRYCAHCRRRMVVQVVPRGWVARCVEHGETTATQDGMAGSGTPSDAVTSDSGTRRFDD